MEMKMVGIIGIVGVIIVALIVVLLLFVSYNGMVSMDQEVQAKWSEVENQYQRQADLIPNLTSVVASAVKVETNFVKEVTEARTKWLNAKTTEEKDTAGVEMNNSLATFVSAISTVEEYPILQANTQYIALTDELAGTQNRITTARGRYIESIQNYNINIKQIPNNFLAGLFGFKEKQYYSAEEGKLTTPVLGTGTLP